MEVLMDLKSSRGQSLTEYIILVALVAIASLGIVEALGSTVSHKIAAITTKLQGEDASSLAAPEEVREKLYKKRTLKDFWKSNE
jgi:Flp pilus assembly pilin Flp